MSHLLTFTFIHLLKKVKDLGSMGSVVAPDSNNPNHGIIGERRPIKVSLVPVIHIWKNSSATGAHFHERSIRVLIYLD